MDNIKNYYVLSLKVVLSLEYIQNECKKCSVIYINWLIGDQKCACDHWKIYFDYLTL